MNNTNERFNNLVKQSRNSAKIKVGDAYAYVVEHEATFKMWAILKIKNDVLYIAESEFAAYPKRFYKLGVGKIRREMFFIHIDKGYKIPKRIYHKWFKKQQKLSCTYIDFKLPKI
jgi:hypothetical protein